MATVSNTSGWVQFSGPPAAPTAYSPSAQHYHHHPAAAPSYTHSAYHTAQQQGYHPYTAAAPVAAHAWGAAGGAYGAGWQGWAGAQQPQQQHNSAALVLYNPMGTLQSFDQQQQLAGKGGKGKAVAPNVNPFVPGLAPLPVVPPPKTFAQEDAERVKFPNSSKNARDSLGWITAEIFGEVKKGASSEAATQRTPLRELRAA